MQASHGGWTANLPDLSDFDQDVFLQYLAFERVIREHMAELSPPESEESPAPEGQQYKLACLRDLLDQAWQQVLEELPEIEWTQE